MKVFKDSPVKNVMQNLFRLARKYKWILAGGRAEREKKIKEKKMKVRRRGFEPGQKAHVP